MSDPAPSWIDAPVPSDDTFESVVARRFGRRSLFKGAAAFGVVAVLPTPARPAPPADAGAGGPDLPADRAGRDRHHHRPPRLPVRCGDRLGRPAVRRRRRLRHHEADLGPAGPADRLQQRLHPVRPAPRWGATSYNRALLWNNHEYTDSKLMFGLDPATYPTLEQTEIELRPTAAPSSSSAPATGGRHDRARLQPPHHRDHPDDLHRARRRRPPVRRPSAAPPCWAC